MKWLLARILPLIALVIGAACTDAGPTDPFGSTAPVSRVEVQPKTDTIVLRGPAQASDQVVLQVAVIGFSGTAITGVPVRWRSSDTAVVTVDSVGVVRAKAPGTATVTAQAGGKEGRATITVVAAQTGVRITPTLTEATVGDTLRFSAGLFDEAGTAVTPTPTFTWASSNPAVATIDPATGLARFVAEGVVRFTATSPAGTATTVNIRVIERRYVEVASGYDHSCSVLTTGEAYCWGRGREGQIGTAALDTVCYDQEEVDPDLIRKRCTLAPKRSATPVRFTRIAAGGFFSCGVATTQRAYCWGLDTLGQLGGGRLRTTAVPSLVTSIVNFRDISAGGYHACGLTTVNTAFCWGWDVYGQLGNAGLLFTSSTPIAVDGELRFAQISAGGLHTCGVLIDNRVVCWGSNRFGQVGSTETPTHIVAGGPVFDAPRVIRLPGNIGAIQVTASQQAVVIGSSVFTSADASSHTCAIGVDGAAYCWGSNQFGELGTGTRSATPSGPVAVAGGLTFTAIAAGNGSTCGISSGDVYCWGRNSFGQTGNDLSPPIEPTDVVLTPTRVAQPIAFDPTTGLTAPVNVKFTTVTAGRRHACARAEDGTLFCWGSDVMGALGSQQQQIVQPRPVRVSRPI